MHRNAFGAALVLMAAMAGCGPETLSPEQQLFGRAAVSGKDARLGDAVMAFFVGPQSSEMYTPLGDTHEPGFVVLVGNDGSFRTVRTGRMDMMRPVWSRDGLAFADENTDFRLTDTGMTTIASSKPAAQNLMFALPGGGAVGVYNGGGRDDGGYLNRVVTTTDAGAGAYGAQGNYFTGALCGDQVFGLTTTPGKHTSEPFSESSAQMLARLSPADGGETVVGWRPEVGTGTPIGEVPCRDGVITFLSWDTSAAGDQQARIVSWNTRTGERQQHALAFEDPTGLDRESFGYVVQDWHQGALQWLYGDGRVFSTDPATGRTVQVFDSGRAAGPGRAAQSLAVFSGTELHTLTTVADDAEGTLTYMVFDRAGGSVVREVSVAVPNTSVNVSYLNLSYMAVRPSS